MGYAGYHWSKKKSCFVEVNILAGGSCLVGLRVGYPCPVLWLARLPRRAMFDPTTNDYRLDDSSCLRFSLASAYLLSTLVDSANLVSYIRGMPVTTLTSISKRPFSPILD